MPVTSNSKSVTVDPESLSVKPVNLKSQKVKPQKLVKSKPQKTPALALPQMKPPSPATFPPPPPRRVSDHVPQTPANTATKPSWQRSTSSSPITQPPPILGPFPSPSTQNKLKSRKSVATLLDGRRGDDRPSSTLATSKSNLALNKQNVRPSRLGPDLPPITSASIPGLRPEPALLPSSSLDTKPVQPPSEVKGPGYLGRFFGFGKSGSQEPKEHKSTKRLSKPTTSTRPTSTTGLTNPTARPTPGPTSNPTGPTSIAIANFTQPLSATTLNPTTKPTAVTTSDTTTAAAKQVLDVQQTSAAGPQSILQQSPAVRPPSGVRQDIITGPTSPRQRAVLLKKPPTIHPTKHGSHPSALTRPGRPPPENTGHPEYNSDSQSTSFVGFTPDHTTTATATNYATPFDDPNHTNYNHTTANTSPSYAIGQTYGGTNHLYSTDRARGLVTTDYAHYPGTGNYHSQSRSHTNGSYSGSQDSGYQSIATTPGYALCIVCNANPQYIEPNTRETSPYCSDICQAATAAANPQVLQATCSYPGCTYPAVMYPADHYWNYCSELHEHYARKGCIHCRQADENGTQLCKGCDEMFKQRAPTIIPVPMDHDAFWHVVDRFTESWAHPTQCPTVQAVRVYKIVLTQHRLDMYLGYRDTLEYYGRFAAQGKLIGNECVLWHSSRRSCSLGEAGQTTPCVIPGCCLCSIIRGSFDTGNSTTNTPAGRFGAGIYASAKASKASDRSSDDKSVVTPWKALLLNNVAAGHECVMRYGDTTLKEPPPGYNSVYGQAGGILNDDELVVYTNNAIRPTWLVMYKRG
ncbi:hypothetical protein BDM02DRAFT_3140877 [Thelephora ganbajun]|uniref:Uncharacterized protein n=1 Tax=Thelephora ganbajun TaxID=370292 RepID=A0ACB6ZM66_THEGA|nr:hypothetical protein BDM02DRAFT_3140877 [Thelephora ganbajun]